MIESVTDGERKKNAFYILEIFDQKFLDSRNHVFLNSSTVSKTWRAL